MNDEISVFRLQINHEFNFLDPSQGSETCTFNGNVPWDETTAVQPYILGHGMELQKSSFRFRYDFADISAT